MITAEGFRELIRQLMIDMAPQLQAAALVIASEIQDRIAPYPPPPPWAGQTTRWYERGYGPRWRRADGSVGGRKTSEMLGRRWDIQEKPLGAELRNLASYSGYVHGARTQSKLMDQLAWKTDAIAIGEVERLGIIEREVEAAIRRTLEGFVME